MKAPPNSQTPLLAGYVLVITSQKYFPYHDLAEYSISICSQIYIAFFDLAIYNHFINSQIQKKREDHE